MADIKTIVTTLRNSIRNNKTLTAQEVQSATEDLKTLGYSYDDDLFPSLPPNSKWSVGKLDRPESLAEALLWKMGKWKIYKSFVDHYNEKSTGPKKTDTVFYAFAKHLKDSNNPIYDQHALRAIWAIDANLEPSDMEVCRKLLTSTKGDSKGKWKDTASGSDAKKGYILYVMRIRNLISESNEESLRALDRLLMPLGQALKAETGGITEFNQLVDFSD